MALFVGTSGWQYRSWKGAFYPATLRTDEWLEYYARHFSTVEVNNTFYSLPESHVFARWHDATPPDFRFALKLSRYVTHIKRLREPQAAVELFLERAAPLRRKLGPVLVQLPPTLGKDAPRLRELLRAIPRRLRVAVEFRHASWFDTEVSDLLSEYGASLCLADRRSHLQGPDWRTTHWDYVRLHEGRAQPPGAYGKTALRNWASRTRRRARGGRDIYIYFNNDAHCQAVYNATCLRAALPGAEWSG